MTNWINNIWSQVQSGEMTMKEADKIYPMEHMTGDAGDFTGGFKRWLNSSESKQFRKASKNFRINKPIAKLQLNK